MPFFKLADLNKLFSTKKKISSDNFERQKQLWGLTIPIIATSITAVSSVLVAFVGIVPALIEINTQPDGYQSRGITNNSPVGTGSSNSSIQTAKDDLGSILILRMVEPRFGYTDFSSIEPKDLEKLATNQEELVILLQNKSLAMEPGLFHSK